jgi:hypothetical protein
MVSLSDEAQRGVRIPEGEDDTLISAALDIIAALAACEATTCCHAFGDCERKVLLDSGEICLLTPKWKTQLADDIHPPETSVS